MIGVKCLRAKREGVRVDSLSVLLDFQENGLPENVKVGFLSYKVRAYVTPPLQVSKVWSYSSRVQGGNRRVASVEVSINIESV